MPTKMKLVFAGTYEEAREEAQRRHWPFEAWTYVSSLNVLRGLTPDEWEIIKIGTWYENDEAVNALEYWELRHGA